MVIQGDFLCLINSVECLISVPMNWPIRIQKLAREINHFCGELPEHIKRELACLDLPEGLNDHNSPEG